MGWIRWLGLALVLSWALGACALVPDPRPGRQVVVATWNVENLFDEVDDGGEYPEFDPSRGWTRAQFWGRCEALARVIRTLGADILVLVEVEGAHALDTLNTRFLGDLGYRYSFLAPAEVAGVKTAVLSRYPLGPSGLHFPASGDFEPLRPLVEVSIDLGGRRLVVIGNHWKSRIPSPATTEALRRESARILTRRLVALEAEPDRPFVVAVGDFNTSVELSRPWPDKALGSATSGATESGALVVVSPATEARKSRRAGAVWDPWETVTEPAGSYLYKGEWNRLDHTFVTASSLRCPDWAVGDFAVRAFAETPLAYGPRSPGGVSDHFPLVLTLVRRSP